MPPKLKIVSEPFFQRVVYEGANPHLLVKEIRDRLARVMTISPTDIEEYDYQHKKLPGGKEEFSVYLEAYKKMDVFSRIVLAVTISGEMVPVGKGEVEFEGTLDVFINGTVETIYKQETAIQSSLLFTAFRSFYHKVLYNDVLEEYEERMKKYVIRVTDEIRSFFNLMKRHGG